MKRYGENCKACKKEKLAKLINAAAILAFIAGIVISGRRINVYAGTDEYADILTQDSGSSKTIDLNNTTGNELITEDEDGIAITIDKSGAYILTGSNEREDIYKDVTITVSEKVTADIYLNTFYLVNDDIVSDETDSHGIPKKEGICPFIINGTANICINSASSIYAVNEAFDVKYGGKLSFVKSENSEAVLTVGLTVLPDPMALGECIISGSGDVSIYDAYVSFTLSNRDDELSTCGSYDFTCSRNKVYLGGSNFSFGREVQFGNITIGVYQLKSNPNINFDYDAKIKDTYGNEYVYYTKGELSNLPANAKVIQFGKIPAPNMVTDGTGTIYHVFLPAYSCYYFLKESDLEPVKAYYFNGEYIDSSKTVSAYTVEFKYAEAEAVIYSYYAAEGEEIVFLPEDEMWDYEYYLEADNTPVNAGQKVSANMIIKAQKKEKGAFDVYVDGDLKQAKPGDTVASVLGEEKKDRLVIDITKEYTARILMPEDILTKPVTLKTINLEYTYEDEKIWFKLNNADDLTAFAELTNKPYYLVEICGRLCNDVTLGSSFPMIANNTSFKGIFDGQGHTVTLAVKDKFIDYTNPVSNDTTAFIKYIGGNAEVRNLNIAGTVSGARYVGGLIGKHNSEGGKVRVINCTNSAKINLESDPIGSMSYFLGGLVAYSSGSPIEIENCANFGRIVCGAADVNKFVGGIIGYNNNEKSYAANCISTDDNTYISDVTAEHSTGNTSSITQINCYSCLNMNEEYQKNLRDFYSGEVTYLLNEHKVNNVTWYQTCGNDSYPSTVGNPSTQTVYAGYSDCDEIYRFYSNSPIAHTEQGHMVDPDGYTYIDGIITSGCIYCDRNFTAEINVWNGRLDGFLDCVDIDYDSDWRYVNFPEITVKYADSLEGTYTENKPTEVGTWYAKAYVGEKEFSLGSFRIDYGYSTRENVLSIIRCVNEACTEHTSDKVITLTLTRVNDIVDYAPGEREIFNRVMGTAAPDIEFYSGATKLSTAPSGPGKYTAVATITFEDRPYTANLVYTIEKKTQTPPTGLTSQPTSTVGGNDGRILNVTTGMEYSVDSGSSWKSVTGNEISGLKAGTVLVRYKENTYYLSSSYAYVTVEEHTHTGETVWIKTAGTHKQIYDCCKADLIPEEAHAYGTEGDARFTCEVCGYVDADKKAAISKSETGSTGTETGSTGTETGNTGSTETGSSDHDTGKKERVALKVKALEKKFDGKVKVVGAEDSIKDAIRAEKKNGVFYGEDGKKVIHRFVTDAKGNIYYTGKTGKPVKKAIVTDGTKYYYCGKKGNVIKNKAFTLADGTRMLASKSGAVVTKSNAKVKIDGKYYLTAKRGVLAYRQIIKTSDGKQYYADKYGVMVTDKTVTVKGTKYKADAKGVLKSSDSASKRTSSTGE